MKSEFRGWNTLIERLLGSTVVAALATCVICAEIPKADMLYLRVIVTDKWGRNLITGLQRDDFELFERQQQRPIEYFSDQPDSVSVALVLDLSGSVRHAGLPAAREVVDLLNDLTKQCGETLILTFAGEIALTKRFEDVEPILPSGGLLEQLRDPAGVRSSSIQDALLVAAELLHNRAAYGRRLMILVSDGDDMGSLYSSKETQGRVAGSGARLCVIDPTREDDRDLRMLRRLTGNTGGSILLVPKLNREGLAVAVRWFLSEQEHEYVLGFRPEEAKVLERDDLKVRVRGKKVRFTISTVSLEPGQAKPGGS
ncbi:MAG: hypothetical protein P8Z74_18875 [Acidobacteriota bacterium]